MDKLKTKTDVWRKRIKAARNRRDEYCDTWRYYYRLYRDSEVSIKSANDDEKVNLPNGDRVKLSLVYRNIEQTLAMLESNDLVVDVTSRDHSTEQNFQDTHREKILESSLLDSLYMSGMVGHKDIQNRIKQDGVIIGHGISYSHYRIVNKKVTEQIPIMKIAGDGIALEYDVDENGKIKTRKETRDEVVWENCQDDHVPPFEFLMDSDCYFLEDSRWHGREKIVPLSMVKNDPRYQVPAGVKGSKLKMTDYYHDGQYHEWHISDDLVRTIDIWDCESRQLVTFLECMIDKSHMGNESNHKSDDSMMSKAKNYIKRSKSSMNSAKMTKDLHVIRVDEWPVSFDSPDRTPFNFFVPIPTNGDPFGISQIQHIRIPADEADKTQTRIVNALREMKRIFFVKKGRVASDQITKLFNSPDRRVVEIDATNYDDELHRLVHEVPTPRLTPDLYAAPQEATANVRAITGISDIPIAGAETASEVEALMSVGGARLNRKRFRFLMFLTNVAYCHKSLKETFAPEVESVKIEDDFGGYMSIEFGRQVYAGNYRIMVLPFNDASQRSPVHRKLLLDLSARLTGQYGPKFDRLILREVFRELDLRNANRLVEAIPLQVQAEPGVQQTPPDDFNPNDLNNPQAIREAINLANE